MSLSQEAYEYDELPRGDTFRYLVLQPGTGDEPLKCNLYTATMTETQFEAISYVWGSNTKDQEIICDGHIMKITTNLSRVLYRVRLPAATRTLWADSICINQDDLEEKGHQVAIMGQIYRSAERVLIYIGSDDGGHGPHVCSLLDDVNEMIDNTCKQLDMPWDSFPYPDWFKRGWVVQEAVLAQFGQVMWGESELSWERLMRVYIWLGNRAPSTYNSGKFWSIPIGLHLHLLQGRHKSFTQALSLEKTWSPPSLLSILYQARALQLADPRDRIYAFMELSRTPERGINLYPNYSDPPLEVYRQFAIQYTQSAKDINIISYVDHDLGTLPSDIPSWIPRWDVSWAQMFTTEGPGLQSRVISTYEPTVIDDTTLKVRGVIVDTVLWVSNPLFHTTTTPETIQDIWDIVNMLIVECPYPVSLRLDVFLDALCSCGFKGTWSEWRQARAAFVLDAQLIDAYTDYFHLSAYSATYSPTFPSADLNIFYNAVKYGSHNTTFVITARGYMGLAPGLTQKDDSCAILFGCKNPCILRSTAQGGHYTYLGATFLVGKQAYGRDGDIHFCDVLGDESSKDWTEWDVEEQDIYLC